jgi:hypothetical protein
LVRNADPLRLHRFKLGDLTDSRPQFAGEGGDMLRLCRKQREAQPLLVRAQRLKAG